MKLCHAVTFVFVLFSCASFGFTLEDIRLGGSEKAELTFVMKEAESVAPQMKVNGNVIELSFANVTASPTLLTKSVTGHALIQKVGLIPDGDKGLKARVVISGVSDNLKDRIRLEKEEANVRLFVDYAVGGEKVSSWKVSEEMPIGKLDAAAASADKGKSPGVLLALFLMVVCGAVVTVFLLKVSKQKTTKKGSRKYLIEQLAYHSMGNRNGVSLLKVGNEFLLVGVTSEQITMLSSLPELKKRYEEESVYEREHFAVAVEEELGRLKGSKRRGVEA